MRRVALEMITLAATIIIPSLQVFAEDLIWGGHAKYQFTSSNYDSGDLSDLLGPSHAIDSSLDARVNLAKRLERFEFVAQGELLGAVGDNVETAKDSNRSPFTTNTFHRTILPNDDRRLFRLTKSFIDDSDAQSEVRFDRLNASYSNERYVARLGRQAISWGDGLVFQVLDPFNPFSPTEIDRDYKTGDDMVYQQLLFEGGEDIQLLLIPRRDNSSDDIDSSDSSYATKLRGQIGTSSLGYDLVLARHYNDFLYGAGVNKEFLEAIWRVDVLLTDLADSEQAVSLVANVDRSWILFDKNVYGFVEYFRSGVGVSGDNYAHIDSALSDRIERGELFTLGSDYLAVGGQIELDPRINLFVSDIANLHDASGVAQFRVIFDLMQDLLLTTGMNLPYGARDTEFGGVRIGEEDIFLAAGWQGYGRLSYFF